MKTFLVHVPVIKPHTYFNFFACAACLIACGYLVKMAVEKSLALEEQTLAVINMPAYIPPTTPKSKGDRAQSLHGLFGKTIDKPEKVTQHNIKVIEFGPKSLEGIFTQDGRAWAIVTDQKNESQLITPDNIIAFTTTSITFESSQGIKSLHIKRDDQGVDIRKSRLKEVTQTSGVKKISLSRAEKIRKAMLERAQKKNN
jgi:hypothetical protein